MGCEILASCVEYPVGHRFGFKFVQMLFTWSFKFDHSFYVFVWLIILLKYFSTRKTSPLEAEHRVFGFSAWTFAIFWSLLSVSLPGKHSPPRAPRSSSWAIYVLHTTKARLRRRYRRDCQHLGNCNDCNGFSRMSCNTRAISLVSCKDLFSIFRIGMELVFVELAFLCIDVCVSANKLFLWIPCTVGCAPTWVQLTLHFWTGILLLARTIFILWSRLCWQCPFVKDCRDSAAHVITV